MFDEQSFARHNECNCAFDRPSQSQPEFPPRVVLSRFDHAIKVNRPQTLSCLDNTSLERNVSFEVSHVHQIRRASVDSKHVGDVDRPDLFDSHDMFCGVSIVQENFKSKFTERSDWQALDPLDYSMSRAGEAEIRAEIVGLSTRKRHAEQHLKVGVLITWLSSPEGERSALGNKNRKRRRLDLFQNAKYACLVCRLIYRSIF